MRRAPDGYTVHMSIRLALLGDSIAHGQGASSDNDTLAVRLAIALRTDGHDVETRVLAVRGARSADLNRQVDAAVRWNPDVSVVVIGANDLTHRVTPAAAAAALRTAVQQLRKQESEVVVVPAPDLSVVPHIPAQIRAAVGAASRRMRAEQMQAALAAGARIADADSHTTLRFGSDQSLFSADLFHPSSAGYAVIAEAVLPEVRVAVENAAETKKKTG